MKAIENILPPETMNRIGRDNVYVFRDLSESDKKIIVDNMIDEALNELDDSVRGLTNDKYTKKLRGLLKKEALKVTVGKLCTRSLRELKEAVIDTIILTAANVNGK